MSEYTLVWNRLHKRNCEDAIKTFSEHQIIEHREGRWLLKRVTKDSMGAPVVHGDHWMEVLETHSGLFVSGDFDFVFFERTSSNDHIRWMGNKELGDDYALEKATIGMCGDRDLKTFEIDLFRAKMSDYIHAQTAVLSEHMDSVRDSPGELESAAQERNAWSILLSEIIVTHSTNTTEELRDRLIELELEMDSETLGDLGLMPNLRFYRAHQIVRKLTELLNKDAEKATPF